VYSAISEGSEGRKEGRKEGNLLTATGTKSTHGIHLCVSQGYVSSFNECVTSEANSRSVTLREEQRMRVFELCSLYSSPNIVRVIKSRRMR
jgi:hypothetical protein